MDVSGLVMIAAPWNFAAFPQQSREKIIGLWEKAKPVCERLGYVPMEVLQSGFWALDPARTIRKYAAFADLPEKSDEAQGFRSEEHTSELQSLMRISYAVFCLKKTKNICTIHNWKT